MIQLFKNIENYKELSLKDMLVVARSYDYFVPENNAEEYSRKVVPLINEGHEKVHRCLSAFEGERKELSSIIEKYFDKEYFEKQKSLLKDNMFDTDYILKKYLNEMTNEQLCDFGQALVFGHYIADLFMTENNRLDFSWDLAIETNTVMKGGIFDKLINVPKEKIIDIYLKYIYLNIILADNVAEIILAGEELNDVYNYIATVLDMKYKNLYRIRILM